MIISTNFQKINLLKSAYSNSEEKVNNNNTSEIANSGLNSTEIYFYSEIFNESAFLVNKAITDLEKEIKIIQIKLNLESPPPIIIYINSPGGDVFSAFSIVDRIKNCKIPIHTYIEGNASSAATLISVCGTKRFITKNSVMMLHQVSTWFEGTYENHVDERKNLDMMMEKVKNIYLDNSNISTKELDKMLKHDINLSAEDCLKYGFVDKIV